MMARPTESLDERVLRLPPAFRKKVHDAVLKAEIEAADDFVKRVHDLPPELFKMAKEHMFSAMPGFVTVDRQYKPPNVWQVDRRSRSRSYAQYYASAIFLVEDEEVLCRWLESLEFFSRHHIKEIRFDQGGKPSPEQKDIDAVLQGAKCHTSISNLLNGRGLSGSYLSLHVKVWFAGREGPLWTNKPWLMWSEQ